MANDYVLSCCSTADLTEEHFAKRDLKYLCFHFSLDGVQYDDDLGKSISFEKFYQAMKNGADTRTSQPNVSEYITHFTPFLEQGKDILHVTLSSGISGAYGSACIAKDTLQEQFPDRKIYVLDSLGAASGFGLLMDRLADLRDEGMGIDELYKWGEEHRLNVQTWFFVSDLTSLIKGGRVSKAAGVVGTVLGICPLLHVDPVGKLIPKAKIRPKKKVIETIVKRMEEHADNGTDYSGKCYLSHAACPEDAQAVAALIEQRFPKLDGPVQIMSIGTTIGSHAGPGTVALFYWGKTRED